MFWRKKKPPVSRPPTAGCFGKLPATGDFVRHNAGGGELAAFDRWLGDGIDLARRSMGDEFDSPYASSVGLFIFRGEGDAQTPPARGMVGAWAASGDNAGRKYPMVVFGSYDYPQLVAAGAALPIALWPLITAAYELATAGRQLSVEEFVGRVSQLPLPSLEDPEIASSSYRSWLAQQPMQALWDTGFGSEISRFWVLGSVVESLEPFRGQELPGTGLALRLPLGSGDAYAAAVWTDLMVRLARWENTVPNVFWAPRQTALMHIGPPQAASYRELIAPTGSADHVAELCGVPPVNEETSRTKLQPAHDALVSRTDISIAEFLQNLSG